jgi:hypothetical protein
MQNSQNCFIKKWNCALVHQKELSLIEHLFLLVNSGPNCAIFLVFAT